MPVRSLSSSVLVWPTRGDVDRAVRAWAVRTVEAHPEIQRLGYFGSYARGDWGVGSDLDLIAVVSDTSAPWHERSRSWDLRGLPVAADLLIYSREEWDRLQREDGRFARTVAAETVWVFQGRAGQFSPD